MILTDINGYDHSIKVGDCTTGMIIKSVKILPFDAIALSTEMGINWFTTSILNRFEVI